VTRRGEATIEHVRGDETLATVHIAPGLSLWTPLRVLPGDVVAIDGERFHFDDPADLAGCVYDGVRYVPNVYHLDPSAAPPRVWRRP